MLLSPLFFAIDTAYIICHHHLRHMLTPLRYYATDFRIFFAASPPFRHVIIDYAASYYAMLSFSLFDAMLIMRIMLVYYLLPLIIFISAYATLRC